MINPFDWANDYVKSLVPYKPGKPIETLERELGIKDSIKLASNENPLGPSPHVIKSLKNDTTDLALYPDGSCFELKERLSEYLGIGPEHFTFGNGSEEIIRFIIQCFASSDSSILIPEYSFISYELTAQSLNVTTEKAALTDWHVDVDKLLAKINDKTKICFIANPNNPTGTYITDKAIESFLSQVPSHIIVVLDEAYCEYMTNPDYPDSIALLTKYPNLIITRTFSKAFGLAGFRIGYSISHSKIADLLNRVRGAFNCSTLAQKAAIWALEDLAHLKRSVEVNTLGLHQLNAFFEKKNIEVISTVGNFITIHVPNAEHVYHALLQQGVIVRPLSMYGLADYLRITVGLEHQNDKLITAFEQIGNLK